MTEPPSDLLYALLPAVYRQRDIETGGQLRALMAVLDLQYRALADNIGALYDNFFIESCADWLVPYLGAQLGVAGLGDPDLLFPEQRALVGHAIAYRRRKGTPSVVQPLIRAASGWYATASEPRLGTLSVALCRLPVFGAGPAPAAAAPVAGSLAGRYSFDTLGLACALYTVPLRPLPAAAAAPPALLPVPITLASLTQDLAAYDAAYAALPPALQPANSGLYGPQRGLSIALSDQPVPPIAILPMDLSQGDMPPAGFPLFASAPLDTMPKLPAAPELDVTLGTEGPYQLSLPGGLSSLAEVAKALQTAIQAASATPAFTTAQVLAISNALLVVAGGFAPLAIGFAPTTDDPDTAAALGLTQPTAVIAVRSGSLSPFPSLPATGSLALVLTIGGVAASVTPALPMTDIDSLAASLQAAIRSASTLAGFAEAVVLGDADRILVLPGALSAPPPPPPGSGPQPLELSFSPNEAAGQLGLVDRVGLDPEHGYLAWPALAQAPVPSVCYGFAFPWQIGGGPYDRPGSPPAPQARIYRAGTSPAYPTLTEALGSWTADQPASAVILFSDNGITALDSLSIALAVGQTLSLAAAPQLCPTLVVASPIALTGSAGSRIGFDGLIIGGGVTLAQNLAASFSDCTLYPPASGLSIQAEPGAAGIVLQFERVLAGAVILPSGCALVAADSVIGNIGAAAADAPAIAGSADGTLAGPSLALDRVTIFGPVNAASAVSVADAVFTAPVALADTATGLFRYSVVPPGSAAVPQLFCQPSRALQQAAAQLDVPLDKLPPATVTEIEQEMVPSFVGGTYPDAGYARLADGNAPEILAGSSSGSEMGAFGRARAAQRLVQATRVVADSLPLGCSFSFLYLT
jgi:Phage tail protein (Tail_P2_I)